MWRKYLIFTVKKAYHRLSLLVHPDRVEENQKTVATEKFKVLSKIHSILQNSDKRRNYDESGDIDNEFDSDTSWINYWKAIFKPLTVERIQKYERQYLGSESELRDLKKAYVNGKGSMDYIISAVPFSKCEYESRYIEAIRNLVDKGEVEEYDSFFKEPLMKKERRRRKEEKDRAEFEESEGIFCLVFFEIT